MIAKGNTHDNGPKLVAYMLAAGPGERVEFGGARDFDFFSADLLQAAATMQQMADRTTNCRDAWFHTQTRLAPGEQLTHEQWERVFDREEKRLGFTGHARIWSFHIDEATGEKHLHAGWFRIDPETNRAHDPGLFKLRLMEVARWAEREFGLRELSNERQSNDKARAPDRSEMEESRRLGTDVRAIRTAILDCLEQADGGKAFKAALEEQDLMLANGDRRDCFVVVDQEGGQHALNKKLTGQTLAQLRERLADLNRSQLPGVEQAQEIQRERHSQVERAAQQQPEPEQARPASPAPEEKIAARERARPPSRIESRIAECAELAAQVGATVFEDAAGRRADRVEVLADRFRTDDERQISAVTVSGREAFEAKLEDAGIALARVTETDIKALAALREQEGFDRASGLAHKPRHFAVDFVVGDLAAVTRSGDVHRIDPGQLGDAKPHLAADLPSVIETRARFEIEREQIAELYAQRRADNLAAQQGFAAAREDQAQHAQTVRDVGQFNDDIGAVADTGVRATGRFLGGFGKVFASLVNWIADSIAPSPPPTKDQAERFARVAEERQEQQAIIAAQQPIEEQREIIAEQQRTRDIARTQGIVTTGDPEEDRFRSIMQRAARDRDREHERER